VADEQHAGARIVDRRALALVENVIETSSLAHP